jgi:hypothetical protein
MSNPFLRGDGVYAVPSLDDLGDVHVTSPATDHILKYHASSKTWVNGTLSDSAQPRLVGITIDGAGSVITTGIKGVIEIPISGTLVAVRLYSTDPAFTSGSIVLDLWGDTYANFPATIADTITASAKPTLSSAIKSEDTTLTGWTTAVVKGRHLVVTVDSASSVKRVTMVLEITP